MRQAYAPGSILLSALWVTAALGLSSLARATCEDRQITLGSGSGTIICSGETCSESNTYDPGPLGCVRALGGGITPTPGRDLVYEVLMPASSQMDIIVIPESPWDPAVYATSSDDPDSVNSDPAFCIDGVDVAFTGGKETLRAIQNPGVSETTVFIIIDSASTSGTVGCGPYRVEFRYQPYVPVQGDVCAEAVAVSLTDAGVTEVATTCGANDDYDMAENECRVAFPADLTGPDVVFAVSVEADKEWSVEITPQGDWDPAVAVFRESCQGGSEFALSCLVGVDDGRLGDAETTPLIVNAGSVATYYVVVDSWLGSGTGGCGVFDAEFTAGDITTATGDDCAVADPIGNPIPLDLVSGEVTEFSGWTCGSRDAFRFQGTVCPLDAPLEGRDQMIEITVQESGDWSLTATPRGDWDIALMVSEVCAAMDANCISASDLWGVGQAESLRGLTNATAKTVYYLLVDSKVDELPGGCGGYDLQIRYGGGVPVETVSWGRIKARYSSDSP